MTALREGAVLARLTVDDAKATQSAGTGFACVPSHALIVGASCPATQQKTWDKQVNVHGTLSLFSFVHCPLLNFCCLPSEPLQQVVLDLPLSLMCLLGARERATASL